MNFWFLWQNDLTKNSTGISWAHLAPPAQVLGEVRQGAAYLTRVNIK